MALIFMDRVAPVDLVGERQLRTLFSALEAWKASAILRKASEHATEPMLLAAKARVRVADWSLRADPSGESARLVGVRTKKGYRNVHLRDALRIASAMTKRKPKGWAWIGYRRAEGAHATLLEYGVRPHRIRTPWPHGRMHVINHPGHRAFPFLRPAYLANRAKAIEMIRAECQEEVLKVVNVADSKMKQQLNQASKAA